MKCTKVSGWECAPQDIYLKSLVDSEGVLTLHVCGGRDEFSARIVFDAHLAYRNLDEGDYLSFFCRPPKEGYEGQGLCSITPSDFIDWFHAVSFGKFADHGLVHYGLYTCDDCVEVLSLEAPEIYIDQQS